MALTFSQACENNKQPIVTILKSAFSATNTVLEIGSGTGQHACYFSENLPHLQWQTSDLPINHDSIKQRIEQHTQINKNLLKPITIDLNHDWQQQSCGLVQHAKFDGIFTANTLHIVSWSLVVKFFAGVEKYLAENGTLCIYGPFNYQGNFTSPSNANFDIWLKDRDKNSGIRDFEAIIELATSAGLTLIDDQTMPANNRLLVLMKKPA